MIKSENGFLLRVIIIALVCCIYISCASTEKISTTIIESSINENDTTQWYLYFKQELSISQGSVAAPEDSYSPAAKEGYQKAFSEWQTNSTLTVIGLTVLVPIYTLGFAYLLFAIVF